MKKQKRARKILVVKNDKIGDMVLSTNVFRELKKNFPQSSITCIASNANKQLIEKNKQINKTLTLDYPPRNLKTLIAHLKMSRLLKKEKFDLGIDLRGSIFNIFFFLVLPQIKYKIGFYNRKFSKLFLDYAYKKDRKNKHCTFQRIDLLNNALKTNSKDYWPEIVTDKEDKKTVDKLLKDRKIKDFICIVPDASLPEKQWSMKKFDKLIKYIRKKYPNFKILLLGQDMKKITYLAKRNQDAIVLPPINLRVLFLLFKKSKLTILHDGGPMHIAWTAKAKLVALIEKHLGGEYYKPLGKNSKILCDEMDKITLKQVKDKVDSFLKR
jgi:ADP-heptose:LPS heptosyltransferase